MQQKIYNCGGIDFSTPAQKVCAGVFSRDEVNILATTANISAPAMTAYVIWVLMDAESRGIKELYFLARDGMVMYQIGSALAKHWNIDVECKYFYCSRKSLRLPMYCIDKEYYFDRLFEGKDHISPEIILSRAGIEKEKQKEILNSLGVTENIRLLGQDKNSFKQKLQELNEFAEIIEPEAEKALVNSFKYMEKQGIGQKPFALVDSGWKGTMQESLGKILRHKNMLKHPIKGYYIGLFNNTKKENGDYYTFLFSPKKNFLRSAFFNCNVFECMCPANHGMTLGYECKSGDYKPILDIDEENNGNNAVQLEYYSRYTEAFINVNEKRPHFDISDKLENISEKLLKQLFIKPERQQALAYADILFSEDVAAGGSKFRRLAEPLSINQTKQYMFFPRLFQKLFSKKLLTPPLLWAEGSLALSFKTVPWYIKIDRVLYRAAGLLITWVNRRG